MTQFHKAHHPLYYDLAGIVGPDYVSDEDFVLETYSRDTSPLPPNKQGVVARPSSTDEVQDIVKLANSTKIPIVVSGGRASFYGTPKGLHGRAIVVDMTRMRKMLNIDEVNLNATAEAGMTIAELTTRLWDIGWDCHTALQPWYSDTIGGQISGFAGGGAGLELAYAGFNAIHIPGIKVVLGNGNIVQTGAGAGNNIMNKMVYDPYPGGSNLSGMFMGAAGTFGIVTEATYRMYKLSPHKVSYGYYYDSFDDAWGAIQEMSVVEPLPYMTVALIPPTELTKMQGMSRYLIPMVSKGWTEEEANLKAGICKEIQAKHGGEVATGGIVDEWLHHVLTGQRYREMGEFGTPGIWSFFEYYVSRSQVSDCHHKMKQFIYDRLQKHGIQHVSNEGCVATGSAAWILTFIIWVEGEDPKARQVMQDLFADATEYACSNGWYPDCHQGWGTRMMAKYWPKHHYEFMKTLKGAMDPNNIMNPGVWDL